MQTFAFLMLLCATGSLALHADSGNDGAAVRELLEKIEARGDALESLQARIRYDTVQSLLGDSQTRFGSLLYQAGPPSQFRVNFTGIIEGEPPLRRLDQQWVFDGRWLAEIDAIDRSFVRRELVAEADAKQFNLFDMDNAYFVLPLNLKADQVLERYHVQQIDAVAKHPLTQQAIENAIQLEFIPRESFAEKSEYSLIRLWFDEDTLLPRMVYAEDSEGSGDELIVLLSQVQTNLEIPSAAFDTRTPSSENWQVEVVPLNR